MASIASSTPDLRHRQLVAAAAQANEARVREILGEDPLWASHTDRDALRQSLQKVAQRGSLAVARLLLDHGADVEPRRDSETAALFKAAEAGHVGLVSELLARGADPNTPVRPRVGQTALFPASLRGHLEIVDLLLGHGADVGVRDKEDRTPLIFWAAEKHQQQNRELQAEMLRLLVDRGGANIEARDPIGRTPLLWAAVNGNLQLVDLLLGGSSDGSGTESLDPETASPKTAPKTAPKTTRPRADVAAANNRGRSALHLAAEANLEDVVCLLLRHGADVDAVSDGGWTALHNAAQGGHEAVVRLLLDAGASVNAALSNGMTPLHWAAFNGHEAVVRLLLARDETRLDVKDSFDRTPMLCAAERFHRDIVHLLSPVHEAGRLSPAARAACDEFTATIVDFGNFRDGKQHQVFKRSVFDVLYGWDKENNKPKVATQTAKIKYQPKFRWIHLPANNIAWVEALLSKWFIEGGHRDIEPFKALEKCFDQEHRGPLAHAQFMRTFCSRIPSMQATSANSDDRSFPLRPEEQPPGFSTATAALSGSGSGSGSADGGGGSGTERSEPVKKKGKGELITERHGRRAKRTNGPPGNPPGIKGPKHRGSTVWDKASKLPSSNGIIVLFMPFLHYETDERRRRMSGAIDLVRQGWEPPDGSPRDVMLVKGYLQNSRPLHPRRTLDQFFYHGIDTSIRDIDQVVYRYFKRHNLEKKIFMVDQLWMWVLGKDLVVTCFPQRWDQPSRDPLNVVDGIIEDTNAKTRPPVQSVFDLAMLITNRCSGMFDRYRPADQEYQFLDMFESSIGLVTNSESELFMRFNKASAQSAEWLELHRQQSQRKRQRQSQRRAAGGSSDMFSSLGSSLASPSSPSLTPMGGQHDSTPVFPDALLDIGTETSLLAEIKDIRDELNILFVILDAQMGTLLELESSIVEELRPEGGTSSSQAVGANRDRDNILAETRRRARDQKRLLEVHRKDIERMDRQAESIYLSLTHLLDLKQKHSNALEARFARDHAMIAARQGQTIMTFTIVTIIFLPMSFIAAFFSIQIKSWQDTLTVGYVCKYMFGIGLGISIPLVIMAFTVPDIYAAAYGVYAAVRWQGTRWHVLPWASSRRRQQRQRESQQRAEQAGQTRPGKVVGDGGDDDDNDDDDDYDDDYDNDNDDDGVDGDRSSRKRRRMGRRRNSKSTSDGDSLATMAKKKRVVLAGSMAASWRGTSSGTTAGPPAHYSQYAQQKTVRQPFWVPGGSRPGSFVAGRKYSTASSARGWSGADPARRHGSEDLEKGAPTVTVLNAAGTCREE